MRYLFDEHGNALDFRGYSPEAFAFLRKLKRNNRREWFQPRKAEYEELLVLPTRALVAALGARLEKKLPGIRFDPRRAVFRLYRDVRFSADKSPYKTHVAALMTYASKESAGSRPGIYVSVEPGEAFVGAGLWMPTPEQLKKIRLRIAADPRGFRRVFRSAAVRKAFGEPRGTMLSRAPKGWPADHPELELLRFKQFFVGKEFSERDAGKKSYAAVAAKHLLVAAPLLKWLDETVR